MTMPTHPQMMDPAVGGGSKTIQLDPDQVRAFLKDAAPEVERLNALVATCGQLIDTYTAEVGRNTETQSPPPALNELTQAHMGAIKKVADTAKNIADGISSRMEQLKKFVDGVEQKDADAAKAVNAQS